MGKEKEVYAPGELSKTRDRLKVDRLDQDEAKRMTKLLGGEIGFERSADQETDQNKPGRTRNESAEGKIGNRRAKRHVEILDSDDPDDSEKINLKEFQKKKHKEGSPADDPSVPVKASYWDRIKIDKYCGQTEFGIKSPF
ncbi:MAG: hypothetical protein LBH07_01935, partial [Treponema sp.]|nr:hypothetical protein [Treponema sp.]